MVMVVVEWISYGDALIYLAGWSRLAEVVSA
jgi:hypothetical protein